MHRITSRFNRATRTTASASPIAVGAPIVALGRVALVVAAMACLLIARPGMAGDVQLPATEAVIASADLGGLARHVSVSASALRTEASRQSQVNDVHRRDVADARTRTSSGSAIVEPVTIAVLGFTAAALIALRRRQSTTAGTTQDA